MISYWQGIATERDSSSCGCLANDCWKNPQTAPNYRKPFDLNQLHLKPTSEKRRTRSARRDSLLYWLYASVLSGVDRSVSALGLMVRESPLADFGR